MEESDEPGRDLMQRLKPSPTASSPSTSPNFNSAGGGRIFYRQFPPSTSPDLAKRHGIPPAHPFLPPTSPYSNAGTPPSPASAALPRPPVGGPSFNLFPSHSRSLSQPSFFSPDSLPSFASPPFPDHTASGDVIMEDGTAAASLAPQTPFPLARPSSGSLAGSGSGATVADGNPPRKVHRRSQSDILYAFLQSSNSLSGLPPLPQQLPVAREVPPLGSVKRQAQFVKQEAECDREGDSDPKSEGDAGDDLICAFMNLDSLDTLNSSGTEEKRDDSRASGSKTNGAESSENEAESSMNENDGRAVERKERNKRSAVGDPATNNMAPRHSRSVSMDSFIGRLNFGDEMPKLPPSSGAIPGQHLRSGSMDGTSSAFSLEFGNGEFSGSELKKIMANEKLAEIAMADPKRVKRILANRQSAARSKERKMLYISELEHKVQTLQTEATTLSAQLTLLQRDSAGLSSQNNSLKYRLQAMEQQAQLRDALNEALSAEVQRLKLATGESLSSSLSQKITLNPQMFRLQHQFQKHHHQHQQHQTLQMTLHSLQSPEQQEQQQNADAADNEMKQ